MITFQVFITLLLILIGLYFLLMKKQKRQNYPPSPGLGLPIIGHMGKLGNEPFKTLMNWKTKYGPIVSLDFGSFPTVAISDHKLIKEALVDLRFSGRPDLPMFKERSGGDRHGILFSDGEEWMEVRRFSLRHLRDFGFGRKSMETILNEESTILLERLRESDTQPIEFRSYLNISIMNSIWSIIGSERFDHGHPKMTQLLSILSTSIAETNILTSLALFVPWLGTYFPKVSGYSEILKDLELFLDFQRDAIKVHRDTYIPGQPRDLIDAFIEQTENCKDPKSCFYGSVGERVMLTVFLDLFIAGAETTSTTLSWFAMYLAAYPQVQEKMYNEIVKVIGKSRLPSLDDKIELPYTEAVTLEVMRMSSLVPIGIFHSTLADVELGGYSIPSDTMIITNLYSCHFDKEYWGDPEVFRPDRFLSEDGQTLIRHEAILPFSTGKRVCLGENLARAELFLFITAICQRFNLKFDPENTPTSFDGKPGLVLSPPIHKLCFTERLN